MSEVFDPMADRLKRGSPAPEASKPTAFDPMMAREAQRQAAQTPGGTAADAGAQRQGYEPIGVFRDGVIYEAPDGSRQFISPGYTTGDPEAIDNMMAGRRPYRDEITGPEGDLRAGYQGYTFGKGDEIVAGIGATVDSVTGEGDWQEQYDAYLARERDKVDQYREERPVRSAVAEIAGALPTALAVGGGATTGPLAVRMLQGGTRGAAAAADYGFSSGEGGFGDRTLNAMQAAPFGFGIGVGAPLVGALTRRLRHNSLAAKEARKAGSTPAAYDEVARALQADDALGQRASSRLSDADSMLADVGPASSSLLDLTIQKSGPAGGLARRAVDERVGRAGTRITQAMDNTLGRPGESSSRALVPFGDKSNPVKGLYDRAYSKPIDYSSEVGMRIMEAVETRVPASAITAAKDLMRAEGNMSKQMFAEIAEDGTVTIRRLPDVRELDYLTRGLQQVAKEADGKGAMGGTTPVGRAYGNLAGEIRDDLKELVPEWKQAVDEARKIIGAKKARDLGRNDLFKPNMYREDVAPIIARMTPEEKAKVAEGVRMRIDETLANVKRTAASSDVERKEAIKALKELSSRASQEKLAMVVGEREAARMAREIDAAGKAFELESQVAVGSQTFTRNAANERVEGRINDGAWNAALSGQPIGVGQRMIQALTGRTVPDKQRLTDETMAAMAEMLLRRGPNARLTAQQLLQLNNSVLPGAEKAAALAEALTRTGAAMSAPATQPLR